MYLGGGEGEIGTALFCNRQCKPMIRERDQKRREDTIYKN